MGNLAISVENLGKRYRIGHAAARPENFREVARAFVSAPFRYLRTRLREPEPDELIWALKDVSFEVKHGEVLGIIGRNGAGKSTLLKILSRITEPTEGRASIYGRVGSLLEVGTGFHPELTGRENIYLNGTILGMKRAEIDKKFDEIIDFSGIERFLDTPVKRYSSGMYVRLAFAVAAHLEPEILVVDEVLAVGDAEFQKKCLQKLESLTEHKGRTVIFVSHNMGATRGLCSRGLFLQHGQIHSSGSIEEIIEKYLQIGVPVQSEKIQPIPFSDTEHFHFIDFWLENARGEIVDRLYTGDYASFHIRYESTQKFKKFSIALGVFDALGNRLSRICMLDQNIDIEIIDSGVITCIIPRLPFAEGTYYVTLGAFEFGHPVSIKRHSVSFHVEDGDYYRKGANRGELRVGPVLIDNTWQWS